MLLAVAAPTQRRERELEVELYTLLANFTRVIKENET
jgi:hypothetical protein